MDLMGNAFNATSHFIALGALVGGSSWSQSALGEMSTELAHGSVKEIPEFREDDASDEDTPLIAGLRELMEQWFCDECESD